MRHPEIRKVRDLYQEVEQAAEAGTYAATHETTECRGAPLHATILEDSSGIVRKYALTIGGGELTAEAWYYYDAAGRLRFTFQSVGGGSGQHEEFRVYFDGLGQVLRYDVRLVDGPRYPHMFEIRELQPREALAALCPGPQALSDASIADIQVRLFCERSGELTRDVSTGVALYNTPFGEGDAGCESSSALLIAVVQGPQDEGLYDHKVSLLVEMRASGVDSPDRVTIQSVPLGRVGSDGLYYVPFLLHGTGCHSLDLTGWIEGFRDATELKKTVVFVCSLM